MMIGFDPSNPTGFTPGVGGPGIGAAGLNEAIGNNVSANSLNFSPAGGSNLYQGVGPGAGGINGANGAGGGFGFNTNTLGLVLGGIQTIGSLWAAFEQNKLAKKQFAYMQNVTESNLKNQIQSYNTTLADRARARGFTEGQSQDQIDGYVNKNRLSR